MVIAVVDARKCLGDLATRAQLLKERIVLSKRGKHVAAIVPLPDESTLTTLPDSNGSALAAKLPQVLG